MKYYLAVFSSITFANRIKKLLANQHGFISLMHVPVNLNENGCAYCLRFKENMLDLVINTARDYDIKIKSIYFEKENGYVRVK